MKLVLYVLKLIKLKSIKIECIRGVYFILNNDVNTITKITLIPAYIVIRSIIK